MVERSAAYYHFLELTAESLDKAVADLAVDESLEPRQFQRAAHRGLLDDRAQFVAVDLFENERDADDQIGPYLCKGFEQKFGSGKFAQNGDVGADGKRVSMSKAHP